MADVVGRSRNADNTAMLFAAMETELRRLGYESFYFANTCRYRNGGGMAIASLRKKLGARNNTHAVAISLLMQLF